MENWGWPQVTMIVLWTAGFVIHLVKHGEDQGEYNFPLFVVSLTFVIFVVYMGGFFN